MAVEPRHVNAALRGPFADHLVAQVRPDQLHPVELTIADDWERTHSHVSAYESCPRRFFYTHILGIGTARRTTPFDRTHSCIYEFIDWLAKERVNASPTLEAAHDAFSKIWEERGQHDGPYAGDYRRLAGTVVDGLVKAGAGRRFREAAPLAINYRNGTVIVTPDEIAERENSVVVVRKIRTGKRGKGEFAKLEYSLYQRAARAHFGPAAVVEAVHPSDTGVEDVPSPAKTTKNDAKVEEILAAITSGRFPPDQELLQVPPLPSLLHLRGHAPRPARNPLQRFFLLPVPVLPAAGN